MRSLEPATFRFSLKGRNSRYDPSCPTRRYFRACLTFHEILEARDLLGAVHAVDVAHTLRQVQVVGERARQLGQQRVQRPEAVVGHGVHQTLEIAVAVPVEPNLLSSLLGAERLERARPVKATIGAVRGARYQTARPGALLGARAARTRRRALGATRLVPLVKVLELDASAERHFPSRFPTSQTFFLVSFFYLLAKVRYRVGHAALPAARLPGAPTASFTSTQKQLRPAFIPRGSSRQKTLEPVLGNIPDDSVEE